jgi:hypothetical protein
LEAGVSRPLRLHVAQDFEVFEVSLQAVLRVFRFLLLSCGAAPPPEGDIADALRAARLPTGRLARTTACLGPHVLRKLYFHMVLCFPLALLGICSGRFPVSQT